MTMTRDQVALALVALLAACASQPAVPPPSPPPPPAASATPADAGAEADHAHELHLPPVGPDVEVSLGAKHVDVTLATLAHGEPTVRLVQVWKSAFPTEIPAAYNFDLFGSDGFHPQARSKCGALLTGVQVAAARIDVKTHDITYDDSADMPGCYRVKAVVRMVASPP